MKYTLTVDASIQVAFIHTFFWLKFGPSSRENQDLKDHFLKKKILSPEIRISSIDVYLFT